VTRTNCPEALDILHQPPENSGNSRKTSVFFFKCKHPRVQIVSRNEDSEYVECKECGDVFESSELKDMAIEEKKEPEEK
jgi:hypothetical protein